jgi:hypothetical protein
LATAAHAAVTFTTLTVNVNSVPVLPSRISLRKMSVNEGYGPAVSVGVTAHAAFVDPVVVVDVNVSGLVGEPPHPKASATPAAPITPSASRRPTFLMLIVQSLQGWCLIVVNRHTSLFSTEYESPSNEGRHLVRGKVYACKCDELMAPAGDTAFA